MSTTATRRPLADDRDRGMTIIEIVVAMLLLMIVAVSVLPIITQSLVQSTKDAELVTATTFANQAIEDERGQTTCSGLTALNQTTTVRTNVILNTTRTISACPASYPGTVKVSVVVKDTTTNVVQVSVSTLVFVTGS